MRYIIFCLLSILATVSFADSNLELLDPWVRQAPPTAKNLAGYGELKNAGKSTLTVASIKSPLFEKVEMHITTFENGMMKMTEVKKLTLKPGESIYFEPGGRHFMLIKPQKPIKAGIVVPLEISLSNGDVMHFNMQVRR